MIVNTTTTTHPMYLPQRRAKASKPRRKTPLFPTAGSHADREAWMRERQAAKKAGRK